MTGSRRLADRYAVRGAPIDQVQPFAFDRGPIGCVLLHGFTAAPKEMRPLGDYLAAHDFTVRGVRYAGHGTHPEDLARTSWRDWVASAELAVTELRSRCQQVWAIGLSLGGIIGLHLAAQQQIDGVIALAPPIVIQDRRAAWARLIWPFKPYSPKGLANLHDQAALAEHADYFHFPTRSVAELYAITQKVRGELPQVQTPLLLIFARQDQVVGLGGLDYVWQRVAATDKERVVLERGGHIITEDYDKETAFQHIVAFLNKHTA